MYVCLIRFIFSISRGKSKSVTPCIEPLLVIPSIAWAEITRVVKETKYIRDFTINRKITVCLSLSFPFPLARYKLYQPVIPREIESRDTSRMFPRSFHFHREMWPGNSVEIRGRDFTQPWESIWHSLRRQGRISKYMYTSNVRVRFTLEYRLLCHWYRLFAERVRSRDIPFPRDT